MENKRKKNMDIFTATSNCYINLEPNFQVLLKLNYKNKMKNYKRVIYLFLSHSETTNLYASFSSNFA